MKNWFCAAGLPRTDWCGLFTPDRAVDHRHFLVGVVNRRGEENYFVHLRHGLFDSGYFVLFDLDGAHVMLYVHALVLGIAIVARSDAVQ